MENKKISQKEKTPENRNSHVEIWMFLIPCITFTVLALVLEKVCMGKAAGTGFFAMLSCYVPAITALMICKIKSYRISDLCVFPNLNKNVGKYIAFVLMAMILTLTSDPLIALFYPGEYHFQNFDMTLFAGQILLLVSSGLMSTVSFLGEEIGWLGYLFPRLEKKYGTVLGTVFMAVIRGVWHLSMFLVIMDLGDVFSPFVAILLNNLLTDSILVYTYKKTNSVVPGAMIHGLTNTLTNAYVPYIATGVRIYGENEWGKQLISLFPAIILGIIFYLLLFFRRYQGRPL